MSEPSIYERNDAIDANLDPTEGLTGAPPIWGEKCTGLVDKIRRVIVNWRKGRSTYERIPGAVIEVPILDKDDDGKTITDLRYSEPGKWGRELADRAWAFALEHAEKNGPVIDAQLVLEHWDDKKGKFRALAGGVSAKNCPGTHANMRGGDDTGVGIHDRVIDKLLEAIDRRDMRVERMADKIANVAEKIGGIAGGMEQVMQVSFSVSANAIKLTNDVSSDARAERQADRDLILRVVQAQTASETIRDVVHEAAPHLSDLFNGFSGSKKNYSALATDLLKSITDEQRAKAREAGLTELVEDLEKVMRKISENKDNDEAKALLHAIAPKMNDAQATIGPILTEAQRGLILALFKLAGLVL